MHKLFLFADASHLYPFLTPRYYYHYHPKPLSPNPHPLIPPSSLPIFNISSPLVLNYFLQW